MKAIKILARILLGLVILLVIGFVALGVAPAPSDPVIAEKDVIVGAQPKGESSYPVMNFPASNEAAANPITTDKQALGRMLFFDPILSGNHAVSCASCHHPDLGFSDGEALHMGLDGKPLQRNIPTLYEVAFKTSLLRDGRAPTLEAQLLVPLMAANEMAGNAAQIVRDLNANAEYRDLFAKAFPSQADPVTMENVSAALATFERGLVAHNAPFDRFVAGDAGALTASQKRGFALFRSGATSCYKCHAPPTFTNDGFEITGAGDASDAGRGAITNNPAQNRAFAVPGLRNVALTAPYMHDGSIKSLDDVIDFYTKGGGNIANQARSVRPFTLSAQEKADLVNFLYALTDETAKVSIPDRVPSGLAVIQPAANPIRQVIAQANAGSATAAQRAPGTLTVKPGQTIQSVVDGAVAGDVIEIQYGVYHEAVVIDQKNITVRGLPNAAGELPVLDGEMQFSDGISATGDGFIVEKIAVKNYKGNGIIVEGANNIIMRDIYVENTSLYGVYPVKSTGVLVERVKATKIRDAGVYAGQCRDVIIRNNEVYGNVIGIEVENSIGADVYNNYAHNNSTGLFVDLLPHLPSKVSQNTRLHDNISENNDQKNFAQAGEIGAIVPEGVGVLILGGDDAQIYNNTIRNNRTAGVAVFSTAAGYKKEELDIGPNPERISVYGNTYAQNGFDPAKQLRDLGLSQGADVVWDASNWNNSFDEPKASAFPPVLPGSAWPDFAKRSYWKILDFAIKNLL
ncbi:MAG TPA: parallel beta-helix domain-containing protein [Thermoflexales bacterium]|nr:parallel beta-helix domain-containing protein [Thermoflexales bacterium]HQW36282.1 parallel beta-helix domain-containing protein [Thermoflexales bacterium]HQZ20931.1 parallel beta-helix domain-containing protein [Thermoflexales bacterium]HRA00263.1 parallel beta-helix domain-containing protein [Thermoflexales bacterium]